ncbi:Glicerol-3-phosphate ABC-transporter, periplasmic component, partial [human gut metagenome]
EALTHLVDKFNSENDKGIHVDAQYQGEYDDSINKLKSAQLGNMGADNSFLNFIFIFSPFKIRKL